jgi:hypothetical protein
MRAGERAGGMRPSASGPMVCSATPASLAAERSAASRPGSATARHISLCEIRNIHSAARMSAWIGTMLAPRALSASQWVKNAGRFSSSSPTRWPWP